MRKIAIALLMAAMLLSLAACGGKTDGQTLPSESGGPQDSTPQDSTPEASTPEASTPEASTPEDTNAPETQPAETVPETESTETQPPETEPQPSEPEDTTPPVTQPPETVPPETQPPETQPPETQPPETVPPDTEIPATEPQPTEPEPTEPEPTEPEPTEPEETKPGFVGPGFQFGPGGVIGPGSSGGDEEEIPVADAGDLVDKLDALCADLIEGSYCAGLRSSGEFSNYFNGLKYTEGTRVAMNHLQMAPPAHVVMLIQVPEGVDAQAYAQELLDSANPRWMICATANSVQAAVKDDLVLFVMSSEENANAVIAAFKG